MPTHYTGTAQQTLALNTFIKLNRACDSLNARLAARNTHSGLSVSQFSVLEALLHLGPMCQRELGSKLLKSNANITLVIDNLEKLHLVKRETNPDDRRKFQISLTNAGRELISSIFPKHVEAIVAELSVLEPTEQQLLGDLCRKLGKSSQE